MSTENIECPRKDCKSWYPGVTEEDCDMCVDGRDMEAVSEYASTCDECAELTHHHEMFADPKTNLGYCHECASGRGLVVTCDKCGRTEHRDAAIEKDDQLLCANCADDLEFS